MCQLRNVLVVSAVVTLLCVSMAPAVVVISDTFTLTAERTSGSNIVGQTTEIGGVQWLGEYDPGKYHYLLTDEGQVARVPVGAASNSDRLAGVPYEVNPAGEIITISADLTWTDSSAYNTTNANGVGFLPSDADFNNTQMIWTDASLSVFMYATGRFKVFVYKPGYVAETLIDSDPTGTSTLTGYTNTDPITPGDDFEAVTKNLSLSYDTANNTFDVWLDSVQLVDGVDLTNNYLGIGGPWAPEIEYGVFQLRGHTGLPDNRCDNFLIESTNPIPEPLTLSLLLAGGGVLYARKRK